MQECKHTHIKNLGPVIVDYAEYTKHHVYMVLTQCVDCKEIFLEYI